MSDDAPKGHVKIARKSFESDPFWLEHRVFSRWEAWVFVIQLAAFSPYVHNTSTGPVHLERGEFVASMRWLGATFKWNLKRVRYWVSTCEKGARLQAQRETPAGTVYRIVNYDIYQSQGHSKGTATGTPKGTAGAQQGHKREAVKAVREEDLSASADEQRVLDHFVTRHPKRRIGPKSVAAVRKALGFGYSAAELCEAIDGNADDAWHREKRKHELTYVLRDAEHIDGFRANHEPLQPIVDEFGVLTAYGQRLTDPSHG